MPSQALWTPEQDARLRKLIAEGLSASQMGRIFGKSRNAVIGRAHRLKLSIGGGDRTVKPGPSPRVKAPKPPPRLTLAASNFAAEPCYTHRAWPLVTLDQRGKLCAYPVAGSGADTLYCGGETDGARYCSHCWGIMYTAPKTDAQRKDAARGYLRAAGR